MGLVMPLLAMAFRSNSTSSGRSSTIKTVRCRFIAQHIWCSIPGNSVNQPIALGGERQGVSFQRGNQPLPGGEISHGFDREILKSNSEQKSQHAVHRPRGEDFPAKMMKFGGAVIF